MIFNIGGKVDYSCNLYDYGDTCSSVTGGFTENKESNAILTWQDSSIYYGIASTEKISGTFFTKNKIDLSEYKSLKMLITTDKAAPSETPWQASMFIDDVNTGGYFTDVFNRTAYVGATTLGSQTLTLDISSYTGSYYVGWQWNALSGTIYKIWLE